MYSRKCRPSISTECVHSPRRPLLRRDERLVHHVVRKDAATIGTGLSDGAPDSACTFQRAASPRSRYHDGDVGNAEWTKTHYVEIHTQLLREADQLGELRQTVRVRFSGRVHELPELEVDRDDVAPTASFRESRARSWPSRRGRRRSNSPQADGIARRAGSSAPGDEGRASGGENESIAVSFTAIHDGCAAAVDTTNRQARRIATKDQLEARASRGLSEAIIAAPIDFGAPISIYRPVNIRGPRRQL